jgi:hypothetical protein
MAEFVVATSLLMTRVERIKADNAEELKAEMVKRTTLLSGEWNVAAFAIDSANVQVVELVKPVEREREWGLKVPVERRA